MRKHQLALQAAHIQLVKGMGHYHRVEVGRQRLRKLSFGRIFAHEGPCARLHFRNLGDIRIVIQHHLHPVAYNRTDVALFNQSRRMFATHESAIGGLHQREAAVELHDLRTHPSH